MSPERQAAAMCWRHKWEWLTLAAIGAVLLTLAAAWFWIPDAQTVSVMISFVSGLLLLLGWAWWISATFHLYRAWHSGRRWEAAFSGAPEVAIWIALAIATLALSKLQLLALALLVVAGLIRLRLPLRFLPGCVGLLAAGAGLPYLLVHWHPLLAGLALQTASLALRFTCAYLVAVSAWLLLASLAGRLRAESPAPPN
ncbi:MAG: hypothetical protein HYR60_04585 [Acidobacteria bacterium]|nr:hypothetical protein [Acidobacteriota bacterium]MBI3473507.1 hypothetical protein [Candidatus Solibacter usitatus]